MMEYILNMSSEIKFENHEHHHIDAQGKVKLTDLLNRLNEEKRERNSNIALSVAAVSDVTVFGIILSL